MLRSFAEDSFTSFLKFFLTPTFFYALLIGLLVLYAQQNANIYIIFNRNTKNSLVIEQTSQMCIIHEQNLSEFTVQNTNGIELMPSTASTCICFVK